MEKDNIQLFYKTLKAFLKEIISVFPEDDSLKVISTSLSLAMKENNNKIIKTFKESFLPQGDLIDQRNEKLFEIETSCYKNKYQRELFDKLKNYYFVLSENNKTVIWDYVQNIYNICKEINVN
jgi:hypothetical protein